MRKTAIWLAAVVLWMGLGAAEARFPQLPANDFVPDASAVLRCGPAYRYPQAGWIVVHIEGEPYERGFQHGKLLFREIEDYIAALAQFRSKDARQAWKDMRLMVNALFLRSYEKEFIEEMKGIADGASKAGARFDGRPLDLLDIATINSGIELDFIEWNLEATPHGLEGKKFTPPDYAEPKKMSKTLEDGSVDASWEDEQSNIPFLLGREALGVRGLRPLHCSAFAATGPATADGKIVFGHITMWNLYHVRHFNVWLDVKPVKGRRLVMQTFPGGIMSGLDYYMNDAGILLAETTIAQTRFNLHGVSLVSRVRKAMQYGESIDDVVKIMKEQNNGCYSNEWLIADTKTDEIAMFELGTHKSRLWRSSKKEWIGGAEGFYWGCNNAKDLEVRLETVPALDGKPANVVFRPSARDAKWLELYEKHKGKIDDRFGIMAFTTPPIAAFPSCDAKVTTTALAKELKSWAIFGPPLSRTWEPTPEELGRFPDIQPLVANEWALVHVKPPPKSTVDGLAVDLTAPKGTTGRAGDSDEYALPPGPYPPAWRGTLLPKSDADIWLAAAFAEYERVVALELALQARARDGKLSEEDRQQIDLALWAYRSRWNLAFAAGINADALPLIQPSYQSDHWYEFLVARGVFILHEIRKRMGDEKFLKAMDEFGQANAGKPVSTEQFFAFLKLPDRCQLPEDHLAEPLQYFLSSRFETAHGLRNLRGVFTGTIEAWSIYSWEKEPERALIIYGTLKDSTPQREAAERLRYKLLRRTGNHFIPIKADKEVTDAELKDHHLLLIGRPDSNAVIARCADKLPVKFGPHSFRFCGKVYASAHSAIIAAAANPFRDRYSVVCFSGLSAAATRRAADALPNRGGQLAPVMLLEAGRKPRLMLSGLDAEPATDKEPKKDGEKSLPPEKPARPEITDPPNSKVDERNRRILRAILGDDKAEIEEYMAARAQVNKFNGSILVAHHGQVVVSAGYGYANMEHNVPNAPHTKFRLASVSKQFTAMAVLILEKQGKLKVEDTLAKHLDDCPEAWKEITLHQLLNHTSGIFNFTSLPGFIEKNDGVPLAPQEIVALVKDRELAFKPGTKFSYCNTGYVLLGMVIEKVSGKSYEAFVREEIFQPLGMNDSGFDNPRTIVKHRASGYAWKGSEIVNARYCDMSRVHAAGALYSTVEDLLKWDQALNEEKLVSKEVLDRMFTPGLGHYGYGWVITQEKQTGRRRIEHGGVIHGFRTHILRLPEEKITVVVLSNLENLYTNQVAYDLADIMLGKKVPLPKEKR